MILDDYHGGDGNDYTYKHKNTGGPTAGWQKMQQCFDTMLQRKIPELGAWDKKAIDELSSDLNQLDGFVRDGSRLDYSCHVDPSEKCLLYPYNPKDFSDDYTDSVYESLALRIDALYCDAHGYDRTDIEDENCDPENIIDAIDRLQHGSNMYIKQVASDGQRFESLVVDEKERVQSGAPLMREPTIPAQGKQSYQRTATGYE